MKESERAKNWYSQKAAALKENSSLILLWNMSPQLSLEAYQAVNEFYCQPRNRDAL